METAQETGSGGRGMLVLHHLGLGDHLMCHGIIREYCKRYTRVGLFCLPHNSISVRFMYRDLSNLEVIEADEAEARKIISHDNHDYYETKIIGFENLRRDSWEPLEKQFYRIAGIEFSKLWENFHVERDLGSERALYEKLTAKQDFIFVHEDSERGFHINPARLTRRYKIVAPDPKLTSNIFDYCTLIEKAEEIHVIDSSFMFLVDFLAYPNQNQKLFIHRYARENYFWKLPILKKDWTIYTLEGNWRGVLVYIIRKAHEKKIRLKSFFHGKTFF